MDQQAANREQAALNIQLGQGIQQAAPTTNVRAASQEVAGAATQAMGNQAGAQQQQAQKQLSTVGQMAVEEQSNQATTDIQNRARLQNEALAKSAMTSQMATQKADITSRKTITDADIATKARMEQAGLAFDNRLQALTLKQREDISKLGRDVKSELFDKNMAFEKDELGRKFNNERQLADYAVASAKSDIELGQRMQAMQQAAQKDIIVLEAAQRALAQELEQTSKNKTRKINADVQRQLAARHAALSREIERKKARAANTQLIIKAASIGAVALIPGAQPVAAGMAASTAAEYAASQEGA
jgi:hypothetical protein